MVAAYPGVQEVSTSAGMPLNTTADAMSISNKFKQNYGNSYPGGILQILSSFRSFGIEPTDTEIYQFQDVFKGSGGTKRGMAALAQYAQSKQAEAKFQLNNPLVTFKKDQEARAKQYDTLSNELYSKQEEVLRSAPKLFGELTPDQIQQYIAPITQASKEAGALLEGGAARRGLTGSSIELNALGDADRQYKENVLSTGLNVGLTQQNNLSNALATRAGNALSTSNTAYGNVGNAAKNLADYQYESNRYINELPNLLRAQTDAMYQAELARNKKSGGGLGGLIGTALGGAAGAFFGGPQGAMIGSQLGGSLLGMADGGQTNQQRTLGLQNAIALGSQAYGTFGNGGSGGYTYNPSLMMNPSSQSYGYGVSPSLSSLSPNTASIMYQPRTSYGLL